MLSDEEDNEEREATRLTASWGPSSSPSGPTHGPKSRPDLNGGLAVIIPQTVVHQSPNSPLSPQSTQEISVKTTSNWKKALSLGGRMKSPKSPHSGELEGWWEDPDDPVHILNRCASAMLDLWRDPNVKQRLTEKRLRLEESSGLYVSHSSLSGTLPQRIKPTATWTRFLGSQQRNTFQRMVGRVSSRRFPPTDTERQSTF